MSKSDPHDGSRINLTGMALSCSPPLCVLSTVAETDCVDDWPDSPDEIRNKVRKAVTDSEAGILYDWDARPGVANLIDIAAAMLGVYAGIWRYSCGHVARFRSPFHDFVPLDS